MGLALLSPNSYLSRLFPFLLSVDEGHFVGDIREILEQGFPFLFRDDSFFQVPFNGSLVELLVLIDVHDLTSGDETP